MKYRFFLSLKYQAYLAVVTRNEELQAYAYVVQKCEWKETMAQELKTSRRDVAWDLALSPKERKFWDENGSTKWILKLIERLKIEKLI